MSAETKKPDDDREETDGPAVVNKVLRYVSVSQITAFDPDQYGGCNRRWFFEKPLNYETPTTAAQAGGKELHKQVEHYLKTGEDVLGMLARTGRRFIPKPDPRFGIEKMVGGIEVIREFDRWRAAGKPATTSPVINGHTELVAHGVPLFGKIDLVNPTGYYLDNEGESHQSASNTVEIVDWKTSASIATYAKQGHELPLTVQMAGYAAWAVKAFPGTEQVRVSHGYFQTKGGRVAEKRTALISLATVKERWQKISGTIGEMVEVAKETDFLKVSPNYDSCSAYRGCPHRLHCPRSTSQVLSDMFGKATAMSLKDKMSQKAAGANNTAPATGGHSSPAGHVAPQAQAPTNTPAVSAEVERLKQEEKGQAPAPVNLGFCNGCGTKLDTNNASVLVGGKIVHVGCPANTATPAGPLNNPVPPDAPASVAPSSAVVVPPETIPTLSPELQAAALAHTASTPASVATNTAPAGQEATATAPATTATPAAGKPRGRPRGAKNKPKPGDAPAVEGTTSNASTDESDADGITLFVDCIVVGHDAIHDLWDYINNACDVLCKQFNACDVRCAPGDSPLGFGKWKGALAAMIKSAPPDDGIYSINFASDSEIAFVAIEALRPLCSVLVFGVR